MDNTDLFISFLTARPDVSLQEDAICSARRKIRNFKRVARLTGVTPGRRTAAKPANFTPNQPHRNSLHRFGPVDN